MGYTHYWDFFEVDEKAYKKALTDIRNIVRASPVPLGNGAGDTGTKPKLTGPSIELNGIGDEGHETFYIPAIPRNGGDSCKTAAKPYDLIVIAGLSRLAEVPGITVSSDGIRADWLDGCNFASEILGRAVPNPIKPRLT